MSPLSYFYKSIQSWIMSPTTKRQRIFILSSRRKWTNKTYHRTAMEVMRIVITHRRSTMSITRFSITILTFTITHMFPPSRRVSHRTMKKSLSQNRQKYPRRMKLIPMSAKICSFQFRTAAASAAIRQNLTNFQNPCQAPQRPIAVATRAIPSHSPVCYSMIPTKFPSHPLSLLWIICQVQVRTRILRRRHLSQRKLSDSSNESRGKVVENFRNFRRDSEDSELWDFWDGEILTLEPMGSLH